MGTFEFTGGVGITSAPLINFDVIIDEDISLLLYVMKEMPNTEVFDMDKIRKYDLIKLVSEVYHARYTNPLYFLMKDEKNKEFLDQCYKEFMEDPSFLNKFAISTDIYDLVEKFINAGEIAVTIVYKNKYEKALINEDNLLSSVNVLELSNVDIDYYTQVYVNKIDDAAMYTDTAIKKTFYFSSRGSNMTEDKTDMIASEVLSKLSKWNGISVFDMYRSNMIGRSIY